MSNVAEKLAKKSSRPAQTKQVRLRLVAFPVWGIYDYDRIELQLYRTAANTSAHSSSTEMVRFFFLPG